MENEYLWLFENSGELSDSLFSVAIVTMEVMNKFLFEIRRQRLINIIIVFYFQLQIIELFLFISNEMAMVAFITDLQLALKHLITTRWQISLQFIKQQINKFMSITLDSSIDRLATIVFESKTKVYRIIAAFR